MTPARGGSVAVGAARRLLGSCSSWEPQTGRRSPGARTQRRPGAWVRLWRLLPLLREACMSAPPRDEGPHGVRGGPGRARDGGETDSNSATLGGSRRGLRSWSRGEGAGVVCARAGVVRVPVVRVPLCLCVPGTFSPPRVPLGAACLGADVFCRCHRACERLSHQNFVPVHLCA